MSSASITLREYVAPPEEFAVGVRRRIYNYALDRAIKAKGLSRIEAASKFGITLAALYTYLSMRHYPREETLLRIACVLEVSVDVLFPETLRDLRLIKQPDDLVMSESEYRSMLGSQGTPVWELPESTEFPDMHALLAEAIGTLTERQQLVLSARFGLPPFDDSYTLAEVGQMLGGLSPNRALQIEASALRKLRNPSRLNKLRVGERTYRLVCGRHRSLIKSYDEGQITPLFRTEQAAEEYSRELRWRWKCVEAHRRGSKDNDRGCFVLVQEWIKPI